MAWLLLTTKQTDTVYWVYQQHSKSVAFPLHHLILSVALNVCFVLCIQYLYLQWISFAERLLCCVCLPVIMALQLGDAVSRI